MQFSRAVHQELLLEKLKIIFPDSPTHVNVKKELDIKNFSGLHLEFDCWVPKHNLCFEFQDPYHFTTVWYCQLPTNKIKQIDGEKRIKSHQHGLSLVIIPCWWDGTLDKLISTIDFERPDLALNQHQHVYPISLNPPSRYFSEGEIPDVGELMLASFVVDHSNNLNFYNHQWWIGEKYDGMRFCWNPIRHEVYSRQGRKLQFSKRYHNSLPQKLFIDGELWFGRGDFASINQIINTPTIIKWDMMRMVSFDVPSLDFQFFPFEARYELLLSQIPSTHPFSPVVARTLSRTATKMENIKENEKEKNIIIEKMARLVIEGGGEGLMIRRVASIYDHGRSSNLFKLKAAPRDNEAIVIGIDTDNSSIKLRLPEGKTFSAPTSNIEIPNYIPKLGDVVTFSYDFHSRKELPVSPRILRLRTDLLWLDVVSGFKKDKHNLNESSNKGGIEEIRNMPKEEMRQYLESLATNKSLDPLLPATWHSIRDSIFQSKTGKAIIHKIKGGYYKALQNLIPNLRFKEGGRKREWAEIENRRRFFESFALENHFDPQFPQNWYSTPVSKILASPGIEGVLSYHNNNIAKALNDLFPNIGIDTAKLPCFKRGARKWRKINK